MSRAARPESPARSPGRSPGRRQEQPHGRVGSGTRDSGAGSARSKRHLEGVLKKYTNPLQGWQSRYFVLDPEVGQLQYYLNELSKSQRPPRGSLPLLGAMVVSSADFPYMFTIQSTTGDSYKLRALDAQEQELWMTQLQLCSRRPSDSSAKVMIQAEGQQKNLVNSIESLSPRGGPLSSLDEDLLLLKATSAATLSCLGECLSMLQHNVVQALNQNQNQNQNHTPSPSLPHSSAGLNQAAPTDRVRPWSQRCSSSVNQMEPGGLRSSSQNPTHSFSETQSPKDGSYSGRPGSGLNHIHSQSLGGEHADSSTGRSRSLSEKQVKPPPSSSSWPSSTQTHKDPSEQGQQQAQASSPESPDASDETTDTEDHEEEDLGVLDEQRSIMLHLLSQLKLGMDLTRVVLPTFILEKRSLLEMYANFMAHPDMFLSITSGCTPEERIVRFVEYYLTAFHEGRKGAVAKKPYNPILGEHFHCSWYVPRDRVRPLRNTNCPGPNSAPTATPGSPQGGKDGSSRRNSDCYRVRFVAEQVSHHPPVSGFYCECKEKRMCVNTHVWTKSKFMGMSVGVSMVGEGVLYLLEHDEEYVFTLPCAYARSILTVPWVELGGKVTINCAKSGYSATVTFHTKPFYGGKVHRVTAEVQNNQTGNIVCKAQGEWNGVLEFTYSNGESKVIDTAKQPIIRKKIQPLERQGQYESRRLWQHVTVSLKAGNMDAATEHKHCLEERQRSEGKQRAATKTPWKPKYFIREGGGWVYHPLCGKLTDQEDWKQLSTPSRKVGRWRAGRLR
ncbi:oxysterol-binding protein-related protein 11 [Etheostoma spectabile]|uniref:oxysterol-binding protein-related protein 11 n=1 Tax=Etheostoma spectabile TaxID=54343 RepID=UPI0013AF7A59|nr:oxysterol-binding protein-related protein 11-like [Etheostoma spectabile]XP_032375236.1 oxysterol-binding protein-related protein 11-like [Etheostoma spectabile]